MRRKSASKQTGGLVSRGVWFRLDVLSSGPPVLNGLFGWVKSRGTAARTKRSGEIAIAFIAIDTEASLCR